MLFSFNLYSSLLLVFFTHILIYAIMLWRRGWVQERLSDWLLGWFLFLAALYVLPWMAGFAGWYDTAFYRDILFYTPFVHGLFFGPLLYFYVKSITNAHWRITGRQWLHFLPGALYLLWCIIVVVTDKLALRRYYLMNGETDPDFDAWYTVAQILSITAYLIISLRYYRQYRRFTLYELSFAGTAGLGWLRNFFIAFGILTLLPVVEELLNLWPQFRALSYKGAWYKFLFFAVVVYYIAINGYNAVHIPLRKLLFRPELLLEYRPPQLLAAPPAAADAEFEILPAADNGLRNRLLEYMKEQQPYLDAEITLSALAKKMGTNTSVLSKIINDGTGQNFNDFINGYRVQAVIDMLRAGGQQRQTLLGIAYECGFNSKATFNRAFKKATGLSPRDYLQNPGLQPGRRM